MPSSLPVVQAIDFLCEHTSSKSRVMALLAHDNGPSSLTAVLTCKDPDHAFEAVGILRRALARRDATTVDEELKALTAEMPDAPAGSLRQAVVQAASGIWQAEPGTLFVVPDPELSEDEAVSDVASGPVGHPRLKDLPGKVVRIAHLHEFHVTDEDALLRAAVDRGWEPLPASERSSPPGTVRARARTRNARSADGSSRPVPLTCSTRHWSSSRTRLTTTRSVWVTSSCQTLTP
ncbi:hypothetical protein ABZT27_35405 [Streptomyces sp. NPDC005389]|uniref:hypothetical protein n=1 Tax=Streptomyces sp. NPDC005389 TaxID=3157040 RepID=UPI0033B39724